MDNKIRQDIIEFCEILGRVRDKIRDMRVSRKYNQIHLSQVVDRLDLVISDFKSAVFYSMSYSEYTEIMNSIGEEDEK